MTRFVWILAPILFLAMTMSGPVNAAAISLKASSSGRTVTASVTNAPGINTNDMIAVHSDVTNSRVAWCYLNGTLSQPNQPLTSGTCTFTDIPVGGIVVYYDEYGTNSGGVVLTSVDLTVSKTTTSAAPVITSQPSSTTVILGQPVALNVAASGSGLSYQWYVNGVAIAGATTANYSIARTTAASAGTYTVTVSNSAGAVTSTPVQLFVSSTASPNGTTIPPAAQVVDSNNDVWSVAEGLVYRNGAQDPASRNVVLFLYYNTHIYQKNASGYWYEWNGVWNGQGWHSLSGDPRGAAMAAPVITSQPEDIETKPGQSVTFSVVASGSDLTYQWKVNGVAIAGASNASYTINNVTSANAGSYAVTVSNPSGAVTSSAATLSMPTTVYNGRIKWNPGHYMMASSPDTSQWNIDTLASNDHAAIKGFANLYHWNDFENETAGQYDFSKIVADFNYLQSKIPGAHFAIGIAAYQNYIQPVSNVSSLRLSGATPAYILNDRNTYGNGPPGASQGGYGLGFYQANNKGIYGMMNTALWNQNVMDRYMALFYALASAPLPLNGVNYTVDTNPLVEFVFDWGPSDLDMGHGNPLVPTDYSNDAWNQQWLRRLPAMSDAFPHTNVGLMPGYGASGLPQDQQTLVDAMHTNRIAISSTDVSPRCMLEEYHCTWAQNYFMGNSYNTAGWVAGGGSDLRGKMASMPTVQPEDYVYRGMTNGTAPVNSPAIVQDIFNIATQKLHASHIFWASSSESTFSPMKDWPGFILPGIKASGPIPAEDEAYPYAE